MSPCEGSGPGRTAGEQSGVQTAGCQGESTDPPLLSTGPPLPPCLKPTDLPTSGQSHVPDNGHWHTLRNHAPNLATTRTSPCYVDAWTTSAATTSTIRPLPPSPHHLQPSDQPPLSKTGQLTELKCPAWRAACYAASPQPLSMVLAPPARATRPIREDTLAAPTAGPHP
ncbi:unnamed protein product [Gadus morhua 'NCC']